MNRLLLVIFLLGGCSMGQLERTTSAPLTNDYQFSTPASQKSLYTRHNLGEMSYIDYGVILDKTIVSLEGTSNTGANIGGIVGTLNSLNRGSASTESWVFRMVGGAIIGAAIEKSLTTGQAVEYIIKRADGQLISTVTRSQLDLGECVLIRSNSSRKNLRLEVKDPTVCEIAQNY